MLNWVVNENAFGEEDLGNQEITFSEATNKPDEDGKRGNRAALFSVRSASRNEKHKPGGRPSF